MSLVPQMQFSHVGITVIDFDKMLDFYTRVLGFAVSDLGEAARRIADLGPKYVVVKGGVGLAGDEAIDVVFDGQDVTVLRAPKIGDERVSGAGCVFAAAITAELAKGASVLDAVSTAKDFAHAGIVGRITTNAPFTAVGWRDRA